MSKARGMHHEENQPSTFWEYFPGRSKPLDLSNLRVLQKQLRTQFKAGRNARVKLYKKIGDALQEIEDEDDYPHIYGDGQLDKLQQDTSTAIDNLSLEIDEFVKFLASLEAWK